MQKTCKKHGELKPEDIQVESNSYKTLDGTVVKAPRLRCRLCRREKDMKYKHDHLPERLEYNKKWRSENRQHVNEMAKKDRILNPEKHKKWSAQSRKNKGLLRSLEESLRIFKMDINSYNEMLLSQNHVCKICKNPETRKSRTVNQICRLVIDHCHSSGQIRGLLCHACNILLGKSKDSIEILQSAIEYLQSFS